MKTRFVRRSMGPASLIILAAACAPDAIELDGDEGRAAIELDSEPVVTVGLDESRPEMLFTRIADAAVLADGSTVILDAAAAELRAFDPGGELLWTAAGKGDGPAELSSATHLELLGGRRIGVVDRLGGAMNFYSTAGEYLETTPLDQVGPGGRPVWMEGSPHPPLASGAVVVPAVDGARFSGDERFQTELRSTAILASSEEALGDGQGRSWANDALGNVELPDSTPSYDALLVDATDRIWVRRYHLAGPTTWSILSAAGSVLGRVVLPEDARVLDANDGWLLLARESDLDVQFVEVWRLPTMAGSGTAAG